MIAEPAVLEVAERPEHLGVAPVFLPVTVAAANDGGNGVFESRGRPVGPFGPIGSELSGPNLEQEPGVDRGVPLGLPDPTGGNQVRRGVLGEVDGLIRSQREAAGKVGLMVSPAL